MVGIPGKSKGCNTCRRRKIRCDLGKPTCNRCKQSGRECEGYERYPTFLNRTAKGLEKRGRLEEVKSSSSDSTGTHPLNAHHVEQPAYPGPSKASIDQFSLLRRPDNGFLFDQQIFASFLHSYYPLTISYQSASAGAWFHLIPEMQDPGQTLRYAAKAFAASRLAFANNDAEMRMRAFDAYGKALRELQKALWDRDAMYRDETLAAARTLVPFELFECTSNSMRSWNSHESGTARLVQMRGPRRHQAPIPKQILEGLRYTSMIQALQYRKASFLGSQDWSTVPWQFSSKDSRQKLYDIGFQLAATIEGVDRLAEVQNASEKALTSSRSLSQLAQIDSNLDNWYRGLCQEYNVLCWMLPPSNPQTPDLNDPSSMQTLVFPDMDRAHVMTAFWTLKLTMSMIINQMCVRFTAEAQADDLSPSTTIFHEAASTSTLPSRPSSIPSTPSQLAHFVRATAQAHNAQHRLDLTANIVRSVPYFLRDEMGLMPAHMILWPIRVALYELQDSQPGIDYLSQETLQQSTATAQGPASVYNLEKQRLSKVSSALYDHLIEVKGLGYARQVGRAGRRWGRPMPSDVDKQIESSPTDPTAESNSSKTPQGQQDLAGQGRGNDADADFRASWKAVQRQATSQRPEFTSPVAERYRGV